MTPPSRQLHASSPLTTSELVWQVLLVACALTLGGFRLAAQSVWVDEAASAGFALGGPSAWLADHNMALYYALLAAWVRVFGISELALRAPSVLCFALTVPLVYHIARAGQCLRTARIASVLHVSNAFMVQLAQEARGYMTLLVLTLGAHLALLWLLERPRWRYALGYGLCLGLACYVHLFAVWTLLAHSVVLGPRWLRPGRPERRLGIWAIALAAAINAPWLCYAAAASTAQVSWIRPLSVEAVLALPVIWIGGSVLLALATCGLCLSSVWPLSKPLQAQLTTSALLVPLTAALVVSALVAPLLVPKYLICAVPFLQLLAAAALARLPTRAGYAASALLLAASALRIEETYRVQQKERWREVVQLLAARVQPDEPMVLDLPCPEPFDYYVTQRHLDTRWPAPRWPVRPWAFPTPNEQPVTRDSVLAQLALEAPEHIWLIHNRHARPPELGPLAARYRVAFERSWVARGDSADALFGSPDALAISVRMLSKR
jgi:hypothetical protein